MRNPEVILTPTVPVIHITYYSQRPDDCIYLIYLYSFCYHLNLLAHLWNFKFVPLFQISSSSSIKTYYIIVIDPVLQAVEWICCFRLEKTQLHLSSLGAVVRVSHYPWPGTELSAQEHWVMGPADRAHWDADLDSHTGFVARVPHL